MLLQDLWNIRIAILVFAIYFVIGRKFLYSLCPMVIMTGFPCPGCGLTRAMFMVLRGDFTGAWKMHPFIYGVIILVGWFGMRRYIQRKETKSLVEAYPTGKNMVFDVGEFSVKDTWIENVSDGNAVLAEPEDYLTLR